MIINHNLPAMNSHLHYTTAGAAEAKSLERLSSGLRINRGADDAAGLAVSEKMRSQVRGLQMAAKNAGDGISFIQTTDGFLGAMTDIVQRMRELAIQAANGIYTSDDRAKIQVEIDQLIDEMSRVASQADFNTMAMLTGRFAKEAGTNTVTSSMWIHLGANMDQRERLYIQTMTAEALGLREASSGVGLSYSNIENANRNIAVLDNALGKLTTQRADLGAYQNRLEFALRGILTNAENQQASESRIRDLDMAKESTNRVTQNILLQSSTAMLAQANVRTQAVLQLLR
jgi:flagellin